MRFKTAGWAVRAALIVAVGIGGRQAAAQDPQPPSTIPLPTGMQSWKLIFNDDFDGTSYNTANWNPYADWGGNGSFNDGRECYFASQIQVADGICQLVAAPNPGVTDFTCSYRSGELISARPNTGASTPYKVAFKYGYVEARLRIVRIPGFFGAFWMLPCKTNYVYEWEIDILEVLGHDPRTMYQTYHYRPGLPYNQSRNTSWTTLNNPGLNGTGPVLAFNRDYHTFGLDWQPDRLAFYIDGIECGVFPNKGTNNENIPNSEGYILIQQMVENSWIRSTGILLPNLTVSETFNIDYVRVWQGSTAPAGINGGNHRRTEQYRVEVSPNPMRGRADFKIRDGERHAVQIPVEALAVYDEQGRLVRALPGASPSWDGTDEQGRPVKPGLYFYTLQYNGATHTGKLMRVR